MTQPGRTVRWVPLRLHTPSSGCSWPWASCILIAALALSALPGCGGSARADKGAAGVRAAARDFLQKARRKDYRGACNVMTVAAQQQVGGGKASACPQALARGAASVSDKQFQRLLDNITTAKVTVTGDTAILAQAPPPKRPQGVESIKSRYVYRDGKWYFDR